MNGVTYVQGDSTCPQAKGVKVICHICNDMGGWGKGFVLAISKRWDQPEACYRKWHAEGKKGGFELGAVQFVQVENYIWVANMIAQRGIKRNGNKPPIRYDALSICLSRVAEKACELNATVHMPRIGCGLAGGKWTHIEPLIAQTLLAASLSVTVYDL